MKEISILIFMPKFVLENRIKSFKFAFNGIKILLQTQINVLIHLAISVAVIFLGFLLSISGTEWILLVLTICSVWSAEGLNTALEFLCDAVHPEDNPLIKKSKDVAAGVVLITAVGSIIIGGIIFIPKLL